MMTRQHSSWSTRVRASAAALGFLLCAGNAEAFDAHSVVSATQQAGKFVSHLIGNGYRAVPALMLGLGMLLVIPAVAVLSRVWEITHRGPDATQRYRGGKLDDDLAITGEAEDLASRAFVEVVDAPGKSYAILRDMLRIGREDDNDIRIPSQAVHRYHAAIHREVLGDWHITDLSGIEGNGIAVNGQRCGDARLHDGDVIELGPGRLRFRAGFA